MGNVVPDRFFWALPPAEEGEEGAEGEPPEPDPSSGPSRRVH
jgi:hydroxymethylpyrimidine/phosphomethylpyrimidine kinase